MRCLVACRLLISRSWLYLRVNETLILILKLALVETFDLLSTSATVSHSIPSLLSSLHELFFDRRGITGFLPDACPSRTILYPGIGGHFGTRLRGLRTRFCIQREDYTAFVGIETGPSVPAVHSHCD